MGAQEEQQQYTEQAMKRQFPGQQETCLETAGDSPSDEGEALARVVAVADDRIWLEPMQTGSCGGCASASACGAKGIGTIANRLEARRFSVEGRFGLGVGDQVEVAFDHSNLAKAAAIAYAIPLFFALVIAAVVQSQAGQDGLTLLGALAGLGLGFVVTKAMSARLEARGVLQPRIVRRHRQTIQIFPTGT